MNVHLTSFPEGGEGATGTVIAIDVFRAFTVTAYAFASGAEKVFLTAGIDEALALKESGTADLSIGERAGLHLEGFDYGNSPTAMADQDLAGKTLVHTTTNGTQCIARAGTAKEVFCASLVNARATAEAVLASGAEDVAIVAAGVQGIRKADEDELCAMYIRSLLLGAPHDDAALQGLLDAWFGCDSFLKTRDPLGPRTDWQLAIQLNRFDYAVSVSREDGLLVARRHFLSAA